MIKQKLPLRWTLSGRVRQLEIQYETLLALDRKLEKMVRDFQFGIEYLTEAKDQLGEMSFKVQNLRKRKP
jgi:hypothetical protein